MEIYMGRNMNSSAKQIQSSVSPNLIVDIEEEVVEDEESTDIESEAEELGDVFELF